MGVYNVELEAKKKNRKCIKKDSYFIEESEIILALLFTSFCVYPSCGLDLKRYHNQNLKKKLRDFLSELKIEN